jgi:hypothetical protein
MEDMLFHDLYQSLWCDDDFVQWCTEGMSFHDLYHSLWCDDDFVHWCMEDSGIP